MTELFGRINEHDIDCVIEYRDNNSNNSDLARGLSYLASFAIHTRTCTRTYACTHACTHTRMHPHTRTHTHNTHTYIRTHARTHTYAHTLTHKHTHARTHARTHAHTQWLTRTHKHTHTHARTHAGTHTHTHTYIYICRHCHFAPLILPISFRYWTHTHTVRRRCRHAIRHDDDHGVHLPAHGRHRDEHLHAQELRASSSGLGTSDLLAPAGKTGQEGAPSHLQQQQWQSRDRRQRQSGHRDR